MTTYTISNETAIGAGDLGDDFTKALVRNGAIAGIQVVTIAAGATETSYAYSRSGQPGVDGADGDFEVGVYVYNDATDQLKLSITIARVDSSGTEHDSTSPTDSRVLDAEDVVYVFNVNTAFAEWNAGDRFRVGFRFENIDAVNPHSIQLEFGNIARAYVVTPWDLTGGKWGRRVAYID